jgi:hypothetical protein
MCVNASALPQDILGSIFSHLNPQDLSRAAQVCRSWRAAQELNWVWQNVTGSILDLSTPLQSSWKEQCRVLCRWKAGRPKESIHFPMELPVLFSQIIYDRRADFTVPDDSSGFELIQLDPRSPSVFSMRNLADEKELRKIDLKRYDCGPIADSALYGTTWTIVDMRGKIFQIDIATAACVNKFSVDIEPDRPLTIHSNDREIVATVGNKVFVWDLQQRRLAHSFEVVDILDILRIRSTQNFVLCFARTATNDCAVAVNKMDPSVQIRIEVPFEPLTLETNGSYYSFLTRGGDLHVYRDTPDAQLKVVVNLHISDVPGQGFGTVQMYRNWVGVNKEGEFHLFDVRTGAEMGSLPGRLKVGESFRFNAEVLVVRHIRSYLDPAFHTRQNKSYSLYDFGRRVQSIPTGGVRERADRQKRCLVQ